MVTLHLPPWLCPGLQGLWEMVLTAECCLEAAHIAHLAASRILGLHIPQPFSREMHFGMLLEAEEHMRQPCH